MFLFPVLPLYLKSLFRDYDNLEDFRIWFDPSSSANDNERFVYLTGSDFPFVTGNDKSL